MGQDGGGDGLEVVGGDEVPPGHHRVGLGHPEQHLAGARAGSPVEVGMVPGGGDKVEEVVGHGRVHVGLGHVGHGPAQPVGIDDRLQRGQLCDPAATTDQLPLGVAVGKAERDNHGEAVALALE